MGRFELGSDEVSREIVLSVPLPEIRPTAASAGKKVHRFRGVDLRLAARVRPFRALHDLTQEEVALAVGAAGPSVVAEWEGGVNVPSGMRRRRLVELLDGQCWGVIRGAAVAGGDIPERWRAALRWYRRASREVSYRATVGELIAETLKEARGLSSADELRQHYVRRAAGWPTDPAVSLPQRATARLAEDASYGLRWIEIARGATLDPRRSLVKVVPLAWLTDRAPDGVTP